MVYTVHSIPPLTMLFRRMISQSEDLTALKAKKSTSAARESTFPWFLPSWELNQRLWALLQDLPEMPLKKACAIAALIPTLCILKAASRG